MNFRFLVCKNIKGTYGVDFMPIDEVIDDVGDYIGVPNLCDVILKTAYEHENVRELILALYE